VDLGEVIERAGLLGERERVFAAVVLDLDEALFDVDVRRAVFAHRAELDEVAIGLQLAHGEEQVQRADDVVHLRNTACLRSIIEYGAERCSA
jgi:hypothetical protein